MGSNRNDSDSLAIVKIILVVAFVVFVFAITYFVWVGIMWLVAAVTGWQFNIWLGAILGMIGMSLLKSIFKTRSDS